MGRGSSGSEERFDWPMIFRSVGIIVGATSIYAFLIPILGAIAIGPLDTLIISGKDWYVWLFWIIAWGMTVWQGSVMIRVVHERIIDDMLVTALIVALVLLLVRFAIWIVYEPTTYDQGVAQLLPIIRSFDVGGALILVVVAMIGARANQY